MSLLTEMGLLVVWAFGIWLVAGNQITVGVLTAFLAYISRFYTRLDSDEPHRFGGSEGGGRREAHFRHPRPSVERAGASESRCTCRR